MKIKSIISILVAVAANLLTACSSGKVDVDSRLADASAAVADEDWASAQSLCDDVFRMLSTADSSAVGENQAAELAILYMKLSEHVEEEENVADAAQAFRYAFRQSADSMRAFSMSLPLEDQRHFVLLRRIGLSIDNPVDLMDADITHEDSSEIISEEN